MPIGPSELLIVAGIIVLLFGGAKLPKLARSLGQAKKEFEAGTREGDEADDDAAAGDAGPSAGRTKSRRPARRVEG